VSNNVHFSSATGEWETPQALFDLLDTEFHFTLDVCATAENAKCERCFTKADNGLAQDWRGETCWMNPPYGREIGGWMKKAHSYIYSATIICLVPSRTDTAWWHDYVYWADEVRLLRGRLKFGGTTNSAPFPSAIIRFSRDPNDEPPPRLVFWDWRKEHWTRQGVLDL